MSKYSEIESRLKDKLEKEILIVVQLQVLGTKFAEYLGCGTSCVTITDLGFRDGIFNFNLEVSFDVSIPPREPEHIRIIRSLSGEYITDKIPLLFKGEEFPLPFDNDDLNKLFKMLAVEFSKVYQ